MNKSIESILRARRRAQIAAQLSLFGILASFLTLAVVAHQTSEFGEWAHRSLVLCFAIYFAAVLYIRLRTCPACGKRFVSSKPSVVGSFKDMTEDTCQSCGITIR